ncbi:succinate dehydrogenase cytochrome b subunit [Williamwhitmania taraxaci]|uniref:Succinate dehydrogenase / fumarate reductase cytochrome b subunit n=1 Tax=Williamwhitmania taraxaci TaxID=1640674 RepID=A0A1G6H940_9BACT|nr:succinate dehydrogenase cytochrome b subunit [Williamwhitmania taraxaci]SDB90799.1 succinate dehydrogenase / fumarate reductase cytochrome b subunit [Williamwhitmania taraxaci]
MGNIFSSSIGKKLVMSISGLFLITFLSLHLFLNSLLLVSADAFNMAANFMSTNPLIRIMEPVLALGFIIHIVYATLLTLKNQTARPIGYQNVDQRMASTWSSRNMYVLGFALLSFLVMHMANFFWKIKFGTVPSVMVDGIEMHDTYTLVTSLFLTYKWINGVYLAGALALGFHLSHGFWSAFQTIGWNNTVWMSRLKFVSYLFAIILAGGYSVISLYFWFFASL